MKCRKSLLENLDMKVDNKKLSVRRYNLSELISESYRALYDCESGSNMQRIVEAHLDDVRDNPSDIERLSKQLCKLKELIRMTESEEISDKDLKSVVQSKINGEVKESKDDEDVEQKDDKDVIDESVHDEDVEETEDEDLLEDSELTDEEVDELTKHLEEIRKSKKMKECDAPKKSVEESTKPRKLKRANESTEEINESSSDMVDSSHIRSIANRLRKLADDMDDKGLEGIYVDPNDYGLSTPYVVTSVGFIDLSDVSRYTEEDDYTYHESKTYESLNLSEFGKKSSSKAFMKTFKKLQGKLKEGTALTRQESISLYKAANSAMTHLSVELEHNPEFLQTFKESVSLLSGDVNRLLGSLKEGKAPSKANMKSLAKFSEALLREDEEEEDLPPIEDEEEDLVDEETPSEESEEFDQEYADARVELHKELADEHANTEDPEVQDKLAQDAAEVTSLPGITDEQIAEIEGEAPVDEPEDDEVEDTDESVHDEDVEEVDEEKDKEEDPADLDLGDEDITDDELAELKKHLREMRSARKRK